MPRGAERSSGIGRGNASRYRASMEQPIVVRVRQQIDRVVVRMRTALDLPSRAELVELTRRLEELDRRIVAMAAERVAAMSTAVPALPEAEAEAVTVAE